MVEQNELAFTATSPAAYVEPDRTSHRLAIAGFDILDRAGRADRGARCFRRSPRKATRTPGLSSTNRYVGRHCHEILGRRGGYVRRS